MSVFKRHTMTYPTFGTLQYGSGYWEGMVELEPFGGSFQVIVRATRDGPSDAQIAAMSRVIADAVALRKVATKEMVDVHEESELLPDDLGSDADGIWRHLHPSQVEVADESYYEDGRIAVLIIFESTQHGDFAPAIETADGSFVEVLSGT